MAENRLKNPVPKVPAANKNPKNNVDFIQKYSMLIALAFVIVFFWLITTYVGGKSGVFLSPLNISNLISQNAYIVVLAAGMLLCILTGGNIDLSVGSTVALVGAVAASMISVFSVNIYLAIVMSLVFGVFIGVWQGFWIAYVKIPPFIVTLTGMLIFRGFTLVVLTGGVTLQFPKDFINIFVGYVPDVVRQIVSIPETWGKVNITAWILGILAILIFIVLQFVSRGRKVSKGYEVNAYSGFIFKILAISGIGVFLTYKLASNKGIPTELLYLAAIVLIYTYVTSKTVGGRYLYAIGGNAKAAQLSGINTKRVMFLVYANMSFLAALAGLMFGARLASASPTAGSGFEMDAIASCFIGGASAYGGIGTIGGALIGATFMGVLNNGMSIMGIGSEVQQIVKGFVLLLAVAFDVISKRKTR